MTLIFKTRKSCINQLHYQSQCYKVPPRNTGKENLKSQPKDNIHIKSNWAFYTLKERHWCDLPVLDQVDRKILNAKITTKEITKSIVYYKMVKMVRVQAQMG